MKKVRNIIMGLLLILPFGVIAAPQLVLSFDDGSSVSSWQEYRHIFDQYNAKATFYVSAYSRSIKGTGLENFLLEMQAAGHRIGYHGTKHVNAAVFIPEFGMQEYVNVEILPDLVHMREDGFILEHFAYPGGAFTRESDIVLSQYFETLRYTAGSMSEYVGIMGISTERLSFNAILLGKDNLADILPIVDEAAKTNAILSVYSHRIGYYDQSHHVTPEVLEALIVYALDRGFVIAPFN